MSVIARLIEFGAVLGVSAVIALVLQNSVTGLGATNQIVALSGWGSFFAVPMIYYRLLHFNGSIRGRH